MARAASQRASELYSLRNVNTPFGPETQCPWPAAAPEQCILHMMRRKLRSNVAVFETYTGRPCRLPDWLLQQLLLCRSLTLRVTNREREILTGSLMRSFATSVLFFFIFGYRNFGKLWTQNSKICRLHTWKKNNSQFLCQKMAKFCQRHKHWCPFSLSRFLKNEKRNDETENPEKRTWEQKRKQERRRKRTREKSLSFYLANFVRKRNVKWKKKLENSFFGFPIARYQGKKA